MLLTLSAVYRRYSSLYDLNVVAIAVLEGTEPLMLDVALVQ